MEAPVQEPNWEEIVGRGWDLHTTPENMLAYYEEFVETFHGSARAYFEYGNALDLLGGKAKPPDALTRLWNWDWNRL